MKASRHSFTDRAGSFLGFAVFCTLYSAVWRAVRSSMVLQPPSHQLLLLPAALETLVKERITGMPVIDDNEQVVSACQLVWVEVRLASRYNVPDLASG